VSESKQHREFVCDLDDILDGAGVCALVDEEQVAIFRVGDELFALENLDPFSGANVLARGLVGDLKGEFVVASPVYKQHFALRTGRCVEDEAVALRTWNCGALDGRVWIESRRVPSRLAAVSGGRRRLVVVGNGMAAMRTVEELLAEAPDKYEITVFGTEPRGNYNRILLSPMLAGEKQWSDVETHPLSWYEQNGIRLHAGDTVVQIDRRQRRVISAAGVVAPYDRLLLATGSDPTALELPGATLSGITAFRSLDDVDSMLAAARESRRAVVIGGGLLGLEAASGLLARGMEVTVVHRNGWIMDRQLDAPAAELLRASLERRGLNFCLQGRTAFFEGEDRVTAVVMQDGRSLPADLVVIAAGIVPRVELARACGLRCDRGILVDDTLQTFDPAIYAVGECVQHRGSTYGLVAPLWEQARVCAAHLAEHGGTRYRGSMPSAQLKVTGIELFSAGEIDGGPGTESLRYVDAARGIYKRLLLKAGRLCGVVLYGDTNHSGWYAELIESRRDVTALREQLLLGGPAPRQRQA
jgi:NAD(P)H-dependent nitrite reductase small subunit